MFGPNTKEAGVDSSHTPEEEGGPHCLVRTMKRSDSRSISQHPNRFRPSDSHRNPKNRLDGNVDREETKVWAGDRGRRTEEMVGAAPEHSLAATAAV